LGKERVSKEKIVIFEVGARSNVTRLVRQGINRKKIVPLPATICISGVLGQDPLYRHMVLATHGAFARFETDENLNETIRQAVERQEIVRQDFEAFGIAFCAIDGLNDRLNFGAFLPNIRGRDAFVKGRKKLGYIGPGIHRDVYLAGVLGIKPRGVRDLPPFLYRRLIHKLSIHKGERISSVVVVDDTDEMYEKGEVNKRYLPVREEDGTLERIYLRSELNDHPYEIDPPEDGFVFI
jgi:hypothetical protein